MRNLVAPFTYMYQRLCDIVRKRRERSESISPMLDSEGHIELQDSNRIHPPFPLRIRIPPDFSPKKSYIP